MLVKEGNAQAVQYPYIRHMWAGHLPPQGQPFNNVNARMVGQLLSQILRKTGAPKQAPMQNQAAPTSHKQQQQQKQQQQPPFRAPHMAGPQTRQQQQRQSTFSAPHMADPQTRQQQQQPSFHAPHMDDPRTRQQQQQPPSGASHVAGPRSQQQQQHMQQPPPLLLRLTPFHPQGHQRQEEVALATSVKLSHQHASNPQPAAL